MPYSYQTKRYMIPAVQYGDIVDGQEERRAANIIDNQLYGAIRTHCYGHGIVDDGTYTGVFATNNSTVYIRENKPHPSLEGFINQAFFYSDEEQTVTGLLDNTTYYLYVEAINPTEETTTWSTLQHGNFNIVAYTSEQSQETRLLIATATTTAVDITIDSVPANKIRTPRLIDHETINVDPHTSILYQTTLIANQAYVSGITVFDNLYISGLTIDGSIDVDSLIVRSSIINNGTFVQSGLAIFNGNANVTSGIFTQTANVEVDLIVHGGMDIAGTSLYMGNMEIESGVLVNNRNIESDYATFSAHIINYNNPHRVHASGIGALMQMGDTLKGPLTVDSGVTIDGVDISTLHPLFNGSELTDSWHSHTYTSGARSDLYSPEYANCVNSGLGGTATLSNIYDGSTNTFYKLFGDFTDNRVAVVCRNMVPRNFLEWSYPFLSVSHYEEDVDGTGGNLMVTLKDSANAEVTLEEKTRFSSGLRTDNFYISGTGAGTWTNEDAFTLLFTMKTDSGISSYLGDYKLLYKG